MDLKSQGRGALCYFLYVAREYRNILNRLSCVVWLHDSGSFLWNTRDAAVVSVLFLLIMWNKAAVCGLNVFRSLSISVREGQLPFSYIGYSLIVWLAAVLCYCLSAVRWSPVNLSLCVFFLSVWSVWQFSVLSANVGVVILSPEGCFALPFLLQSFPSAFLWNNPNHVLKQQRETATSAVGTGAL